MSLRRENLRLIHKKLVEITKNSKKIDDSKAEIPPYNAHILVIALKLADKAFKMMDRRATKDENSEIFIRLLNKNDYNGKFKQIINKDITDDSEKSKNDVVKKYIKTAQVQDKWIYLASSHTDCAKDHLPYQGKLYYDNKAPDVVKTYCRNRGMRTIQWVMGKPAWFITRPNCRHFFKVLPTAAVKKYSRKELIRRYKTHREEGDKSLATPKHAIVEEYEDRLEMLEGMYSKHPTEHLRRDIQKTKLLIKKWKNML